MIDFPANPAVGQTFTNQGQQWTWDGVKWLPTSGWPPPMNDNRIINGDMRIDQRNNGATGGALTGYGVDRWTYYGSQTGKFNAGRNINAAAGPVGFPYYWGFQSLSAYTVMATDVFELYQSIEADMVSDFAWGTANAQPVTLQFWVQSSKTGSFSGVISNFTNTRAYPFSFSIPTANTWTKIVVTIPGDTAGTWVMSGNGGAIFVIWDLGSGANAHGTAGAWVAGNLSGVTGSQSIVNTNGATFYVTGVKLEVGSVATPFNRKSLAASLADCQRYYVTFPVSPDDYTNTLAATVIYRSYKLPVDMRAVPTVTYSGAQYYSNGSGVGFTPTAGVNNVSFVGMRGSGLTSAQGFLSATIAASAEF